MRRQYSTLSIVGPLLILVSCSSPKYTYKFDYYDYNSGTKGTSSKLSVQPSIDLKVDKTELMATSDKVVVKNPRHSASDTRVISKTSVKELSRAEKKQLRSEIKDYIKNHSEKRSVDGVASVQATKQLDDDLKLAIIFGAIGITFAILGGINTVFWVIGVIGLIVGLVFFIRWISTQ